MWITHKNDMLGGWVLACGDSSYDLSDSEFRALKTGDKERVTTLLRRKLGGSPSVASPFAAAGNPDGYALATPCAFDDQCVTGRRSADPAAGTCGECVTMEALGQDCTGPHQGCSISAVCKGGVRTSLRKLEGEACALQAKGVPAFGEGEACRYWQCAEGLFCHVSVESDALSFCEVPRAEGEACSNDNVVPIPCAEGLECRGKVCRTPCH